MSSAGRWFGIEVGSRVDPALLRLTRGRFATTSFFPLVLLTVEGRKSGAPRTVPLVYFTQGDEVILTASSFGRAKHPAWYLNAKANPEVELAAKGVAAPLPRARDRGRGARAAVRPVQALYAGYGLYEQRATERTIPVSGAQPARSSHLPWARWAGGTRWSIPMPWRSYIRGSVMPRFMQRLRDIDAELQPPLPPPPAPLRPAPRGVRGRPRGIRAPLARAGRGLGLRRGQHAHRAAQRVLPDRAQPADQHEDGRVPDAQRAAAHARARGPRAGSSGASRPCSPSGSGRRRRGPRAWPRCCARRRRSPRSSCSSTSSSCWRSRSARR